MSIENLRPCVRAMYKIQNVRVRMGLQLVSMIKKEFPEVEEQIKNKQLDAKKVMRRLRKEFDLYRDPETELPDNGYIKDDLFLILAKMYFSFEDQEKEAMSIIERSIAPLPITKYICGIKGCDLSTAAVIVSEINIRKANFPSSLYLLAGLDCGPDGKARSRREKHLVERTYIDKDGKEKTKMSITYNPFLHDKLLGTIAPNLIRAKNTLYHGIYTSYKAFLERREEWSGSSKMHRHRAAIRYMMRVFVCNIHKTWREMEELPVYEPYEVEKLGLVNWKQKVA